MIAAIGRNREIGRDNQLLWHIPGDLKHFRRLTTEHPVIMGEKTYRSIGKPLPNRVNIVLSQDPSFSDSRCVIARDPQQALRVATDAQSDEIFIIGGGMVYTAFLSEADKLYLTQVDATFPDANVFFPDFEGMFVMDNESEVIEENTYRYRFTDWKRKKNAC